MKRIKLKDELRKVSNELLNIVGCSQSLKIISDQLPSTELGSDQICPELIFPAIAIGISVHANNALTLLANIDSLLAHQVKGAAK